MDYFERQGYSALGGLQQPNSLALQSGTTEPQNIAKNEAVVPESCSILRSSMLMVNGIDLATTSTAEMGMNSSWPMQCSSSSLADELHKQPPLSSISSLTTPPPEASVFPPAYPYPWAPMQSYSYPPPHSSQTAYSAPLSMDEPGSLSTISVAECYLRGSSLEDSPLSSPGSCNDQDQQLMGEHFRPTSCPTTSSTVLGVNRSQSPLVGHGYGAMTQSVDMMATIPSFEYLMNHTPMSETLAPVGERNLQKTVKMPQRKGGIQLWQFMYSLLTDPEKKYSNIIEWTSNMKDREFRMLEPEAIAVWWGHHKNKPNMSYDKFSRSLRYYYDKGILKKIPGERYVYRFLIDPEHMYRHIGISECRPKLKPMPQAAKLAMTKHQVEQSTSQSSPIVTPAPEPLMSNGADNGSPSPMESSAANNSVDITTCSSALYDNPPPPYTYTSTCSQTVSSNVNVLQVGGPIYSSASTGNLTAIGKGYDEVPVPPIKRSRSLDCPNSGATNTDSRFSHYSSSSVIPYGQMSQSCDEFSPLPHISAESSFLDNPMLLSAQQGGPGPTVSELNYVACGSDMSAQSAAVTSARLCTQQAGLSLNCKPFPLHLNHNFTAQWH